MTWSPNPIIGSQSVSANKAPINNAFTYIENEMRKDHFWGDADQDLDGRHNIVHMPDQDPTPGSLPPDMTGGLFVRKKTNAESPDKQISEPFFFTDDGGNLQFLQLGFRALVHFEYNGGVTVKYAHNVTSVTRTSQGEFTVAFTVNLPTNNYIVTGSSIRSDTSKAPLYFSMESNASKGSIMTTSSVKVRFSSGDQGSPRDPLVGCVAVIGG
jgi:hypothetical protein